jgi:hypothetical protein
MARVNSSTTITGEGSVLDYYDSEAVTAAELGVTTQSKGRGRTKRRNPNRRRRGRRPYHRAGTPLPGLLAGYLTEQELAAQLGVTVRTLQRWRSHRIGPPPTTDIPGRSVLYRCDGFAEWLLSHERPMIRERHRSGRGRS